MEDDLKKKVAELVFQRGHIAARDRIRHLIRFLDRVRRDRRKILLAIPRTAVLRVAQLRHDREQTIEGAVHPLSSSIGADVAFYSNIETRLIETTREVLGLQICPAQIEMSVNSPI
jgi:hypothetical protein